MEGKLQDMAVSGRRPVVIVQVLHALSKLGEVRGATERQILDYLRENRTGEPNTRNMTVQVRKALKHAVEAGILTCRAGKYRECRDGGSDEVAGPSTLPDEKPTRSAKRGPARGRRSASTEDSTDVSSAGSSDSIRNRSGRKGNTKKQGGRRRRQTSSSASSSRSTSTSYSTFVSEKSVQGEKEVAVPGSSKKQCLRSSSRDIDEDVIIIPEPTVRRSSRAQSRCDSKQRTKKAESGEDNMPSCSKDNIDDPEDSK